MLDIVSLIAQDLTLVKQNNKLYTTLEHDSLKIFVDTNTWYHFSRRVGGDAVSWLKYWRDLTDTEAKEYIESNSFGEDSAAALFRNLSNNVNIDSGIETRQLYGLKQYHPYIASRNISEYTAQVYQLEVQNNNILIPMYNFKNERIGVVLRNIDSNDQKFKYRKIFKEKVPLLWPMAEWQRVQADSKVLIFEGAWSNMRFWQTVHDNRYRYLTLFGVATNTELLTYLNGLNDVTFVLDNDKTGREMGKRLHSLNSDWKLKLPNIYPDEMTDEQIQKFIRICEKK